jgi:hypothetical protein
MGNPGKKVLFVKGTRLNTGLEFEVVCVFKEVEQFPGACVVSSLSQILLTQLLCKYLLGLAILGRPETCSNGKTAGFENSRLNEAKHEALVPGTFWIRGERVFLEGFTTVTQNGVCVCVASRRRGVLAELSGSPQYSLNSTL